MIPLFEKNRELLRPAFSSKPYQFLNPEFAESWRRFFEIQAIENAKPDLLHAWQKKQAKNLWRYCIKRSTFWRKRLSKKNGDTFLDHIAPLKRQDVTRQVASEGSLLRDSDGMRVVKSSTSGSSGTPVEFFASQFNAFYNGLRFTAEDFFKGFNLNTNKVKITLARAPLPGEKKFEVVRSKGWLGPLSNAYRSGSNREYRVALDSNSEELIADILKEPVGYLNCVPERLENLLTKFGPKWFVDAGVERVTTFGSKCNQEVRKALSKIGIPVMNIYSSEEVGPIAFECSKVAGAYHVASSNVILQQDPSQSITVDGQQIGKLYVTALNSYATPFIKYDIGDFGRLTYGCACGYQGPTLDSIFGREKHFIKTPSGELRIFYLRGSSIKDAVHCEEYKVRQYNDREIDVVLGGRSELSSSEEQALMDLMKYATGSELSVIIKLVPKIDWGKELKKSGFQSYVV